MLGIVVAAHTTPGNPEMHTPRWRAGPQAWTLMLCSPHIVSLIACDHVCVPVRWCCSACALLLDDFVIPRDPLLFCFVFLLFWCISLRFHILPVPPSPVGMR